MTDQLGTTKKEKIMKTRDQMIATKEEVSLRIATDKNQMKVTKKVKMTEMKILPKKRIQKKTSMSTQPKTLKLLIKLRRMEAFSKETDGYQMIDHVYSLAK